MPPEGEIKNQDGGKIEKASPFNPSPPPKNREEMRNIFSKIPFFVMHEVGITPIHSDLGSIGVDDHHNESHNAASHSDQGATGSELETLTDGSETTLHSHAVLLFGDGSDGNVTISSNTTLTSNKFYNNLTIDTNSTLTPAGYFIFVKGTLTIESGSKIDWSGKNGTAGGNGVGRTSAGSGGTAGAALADGFLKGSLVGKVGGAGGNGDAGGASGTNGNNGNAGANRSFSQMHIQDPIF